MSTKSLSVCMKESGFTLLELLVSIVLLALIVTISYSALRLGSKSWEITAKKVTENTNIRFVEQFVRKKIEQIYPINWNSGVRKLIAFQGEQDGVKFIAPAPQGREVNEYFEYYLTIVRNDDSLSLMFYYEPHDPSKDELIVSGDSPSREILTNLNTVEFSYYGTVNNEEAWIDIWDQENDDYPKLMRLLLISNDSRITPVEIIAELRSRINTKNQFF